MLTLTSFRIISHPEIKKTTKFNVDLGIYFCIHCVRLLKCKEFIKVDIICVANTVIKQLFGLDMYIARKTLKSFAINFFVNFMISPCQIIPTSENG